MDDQNHIENSRKAGTGKLTTAKLSGSEVKTMKTKLPNEVEVEMEKVFDIVMSPFNLSKVLVQPDPNGLFREQVTRKELQTLKDKSWLCDSIINSYMALINKRSLERGGIKLHCFNSFFYVKLQKEGYTDALSRWTKKFDLVEKDLILVPININENHWTLGVVDLRIKTIKYFDSLGKNNHEALDLLQKYVKNELSNKKCKNLKDYLDWSKENVKRIPRQKNFDDCGVYVCQFANLISLDLALTFSQENIPFIRKKIMFEIFTKKLLSPDFMAKVDIKSETQAVVEVNEKDMIALFGELLEKLKSGMKKKEEVYLSLSRIAMSTKVLATLPTELNESQTLSYWLAVFKEMQALDSISMKQSVELIDAIEIAYKSFNKQIQHDASGKQK